MRHGDKINNLGRKTAHRQALLMNLAIALIENKRIFTTLSKAKALRTYVEPLITKSKDDSTHSRRIAFSSNGFPLVRGPSPASHLSRSLM